MRVLIWQWGRRGAGPRYAAELARAFAALPGVELRLCLSAGAELLSAEDAPAADTVATYRSIAGYCARMASAPVLALRLRRWLRREGIDVAVCAMPAAMDLVMVWALRLARVPYAAVVHDADLHPGDRYAAQIWLQRRLVANAAAVFALTSYVARRVRQQARIEPSRLTQVTLPGFRYGPMPPPGAHGGERRLLSFGRLLSYKGLDLLADGLERLGPQPGLVVRVVGSGPDSADLDRLRALPGVTVENRWVSEDEVASLFGWADGLILSHREASQSGVLPAALAAGRWVIATEVGGLPEQVQGADRAILCPPTTEGIAAAIAQWLSTDIGAGAPADRCAEAWRLTAATMAQALAALR